MFDMNLFAFILMILSQIVFCLPLVLLFFSFWKGLRNCFSRVLLLESFYEYDLYFCKIFVFYFILFLNFYFFMFHDLKKKFSLSAYSFSFCLEFFSFICLLRFLIYLTYPNFCSLFRLIYFIFRHLNVWCNG